MASSHRKLVPSQGLPVLDTEGQPSRGGRKPSSWSALTSHLPARGLTPVIPFCRERCHTAVGLGGLTGCDEAPLAGEGQNRGHRMATQRALRLSSKGGGESCLIPGALLTDVRMHQVVCRPLTNTADMRQPTEVDAAGSALQHEHTTGHTGPLPHFTPPTPWESPSGDHCPYWAAATMQLQPPT